jgi:uncharacterized protein (TIGR02001 family)
MRTIITAAATLALAGPLAQAAPPDTSSMPQLVLPQATPAEDVATEPQFTYSVTAASNYIFRGVSQTENDPAVFGAARVTDDQFYAGAGIENVDFHNSTDAEYDLSGGWTPVVEGFRLDLGIIRYGYINEPAHTHIDTVDFKGVVLRDFGPATVAVALYYTPNFFGAGRDGIYVEGRTTYRITDGLSASGAGPPDRRWRARPYHLERRSQLRHHQEHFDRRALLRHQRTQPRTIIRQPLCGRDQGRVLARTNQWGGPPRPYALA